MLPSKNQYRKWTILNKWSYLAAVLSIPVGIVTILSFIIPIVQPDASAIEQNQLAFRVAQEMRYNSEWLKDIALAHQSNTRIPIGSAKTEALMKLISSQYDKLTENSYGEEKYIYQEAMRLADLGNIINKISSVEDIDRFNSQSPYTLHDIIFLNEFLRWYLRPAIEKELTDRQLYSLGWNPFPREKFYIHGIANYNMKYFVHDEEPIMDFSLYLGLID